MNAAEFADRIKQHTGYRVHGPNAQGWFDAHCPSHEDQKGSLTFKDGDRGVIVKCHAETGCTEKTISSALGLAVRDLFYTRATDGNGQVKRRVAARYDY